jgi:hypothetical protein
MPHLSRIQLARLRVVVKKVQQPRPHQITFGRFGLQLRVSKSKCMITKAMRMEKINFRELPRGIRLVGERSRLAVDDGHQMELVSGTISMG